MAGRRKGGIQGYTVQEAQNSALGQAGSTYNDNSPDDTLVPPTGSVFVAITMIEDVVFASLVAQDQNLYINTVQASHDKSDGNATSTVGSGGQNVSSVTFPAGITIYGRWTSVNVASGSCVAYIG